MRKISGLLAGLLLVSNLFAQRIAQIDNWTAYVSHTNVQEITQQGDEVYAITEGGMFSFHVSTGEIRTFSTIDGLSAIDPTTIYHDEVSDQVFIGFGDGMINYFSNPDQLNYITDINRTELFTTKGINKFASMGDMLYIATDFGMVVYDVAQKETRFSVTKVADNLTGTPVEDIAILGDTIYIAMGNYGLYKAPLNTPNLTVPTIWEEETGHNSLPEYPCPSVTAAGTRLYADVNDTIFYRDPASAWTKSSLPVASFNYVSAHDDIFFASAGGSLWVLPQNGSLYNFFNFGHINCVYTQDGNLIWVGDETLGLQRLENNGITNVGPSGPRNNFVTQISAANGEFYVAPRGKKGTSDRHYDKSGVYYFSYGNEGWKNSDYLNERLDQDQIWLDFARVFLHPATGRAFAASWGEGVIEFKNGDVVRYITPKNSGLSPSTNIIGDSSARCSGLYMDDQQNLWITQILGDFCLNVQTASGDWYNYFSSGINPIDIIADDYGNKWIINQGQGITVFNENGTFANTADDKIKYLTNLTGQGGLPNNSVNTLAKDLDGHIWVGTTEGVVIFYDPGSVFTAGYPDAQCPYVDGFCLLRDQKVTSIAVDGANRKWIATENGVYLISEDGTEQLDHFTVDNSPLFDDEVKHISIDNSTGEVLIGTNKGILSIMGEATGGQENSDDLVVFPNPVMPDYDGLISITGSVAEADVKITTVDGALVKQLSSLGGQTTWDGTDEWGNRVRPGIYLVMLADNDGEKAGIAKIAILDR